MMGLFIISKLLLMTLLLQTTGENVQRKTRTAPEPDNSVRFGEFCLRISDDSHRTISESETQPPTKSARPTKRAAQSLGQPAKEPNHPPTQPTPTVRDSTQMPEQTTQPQTTIDGCRCQDRESELPPETSQFRTILIHFPSESCNSLERIGMLKDGREVCLSTLSPLAYYDELLRLKPTPVVRRYEVPVTPPTPLDPITELSTTTQPFPEDNMEYYEPDLLSGVEGGGGGGGGGEEEEVIYICGSCNFTTNLDDVDPKAVQSLNVIMQPFPCPLYIIVILKNNESFCLDSDQPEFQTMLEKLEVPPPHEDYLDHTLKNITDGCRCQEREEKLPNETFQAIGTRIWPPSETCNSTEFIEILMDGREVCVPAYSLLAYMKSAILPSNQSEPAGPAGGNEESLETAGLVDTVHQDEPVSSLLSMNMNVVEATICVQCIPIENWNVDPKDVQSLQMEVLSFHCPVLMHVTLKNQESFCLDSSQARFRTLLEKLEIQTH